MSMAGAQRALRYWTCFAVAFGVIGNTSAVTVDSSYDQVVQACALCDNQFAYAALAYQQTFGTFSKAIDGAKFHCSVMANVSLCYEDCQAGSIYIYSSQNKGLFDLFYRDYCDPACYTAIMPYCYLKTFGTLDNSLTCSGGAMNAALRDCLKVEFFDHQNCSSACTPGQRKALYLFMQFQIPCFFSYTTQISCYTSVQYCTEKYYGDAGSDYSGLTDPILANSNAASCKHFNTDYYDCLESTLSGTISFGEGSSVTTYERPCQGSVNSINYLEDFSSSFLADPFCKGRNTTLDAVCRAFVTTTTARVTRTTTAAARPTAMTTTKTTRTTGTTRIAATTTTSTAKTTRRSDMASRQTTVNGDPALGTATAAEAVGTDASLAGEFPDTNSNDTTTLACELDDCNNSGSGFAQAAEKSRRLCASAALMLLILRWYFFSLS